MSLNEILNLASNLTININQPNVNKKTDNNQEVVQLPAINVSISTDDENDIKTKESKTQLSTNLSFVDNSSSPNISIGISVHTTAETKKLIDFGMTMFRQLGPEGTSLPNGRIKINDSPVASIILNTVIYASQMNISDPENHEARKSVMHVPHHAVEKMINHNTKESDFSQEEKDFLWQKAGIKVQQNDNGKAEYYYYETPESKPVKLTEDQVKEIYSHILNIENDSDLFKYSLDSGKKLNEQIEEFRRREIDNEEGKTNINTNNHEFTQNDNISSKSSEFRLNFPEAEERDNKKTNVNNDTNYVNTTVEERKKSTKYHFKKLGEMDDNRYQKNRDNANKMTENRIEIVRKEEKRINNEN